MDKARVGVPPETRFWHKVTKTEGCWTWKGATDNAGYGQFHSSDKYWAAHRYSWTLRHGVIAPGLVVRHLCHNKSCVNPEHLAIGTQKDNIQDSVRDNRFRVIKRVLCVRGHVFIATKGSRCATCKKELGPVYARMSRLRLRLSKNDLTAESKLLYTDELNSLKARLKNSRVVLGSDGERFYAKVRKTKTCWFWMGRVNVNGYGVFFARKPFYSHRWSYATNVGPIPDGMLIRHSCHVRSCVNPQHLSPGTALDNARDSVLSGPPKKERRKSKYCIRGHERTPENTSPGPRCKLCRKIVAEIHHNSL